MEPIRYYIKKPDLNRRTFAIYSRVKSADGKVSARHKYRRAIERLGKHSVLSVTRDEALACVLKLSTNWQQREVTVKLNTFFKRIGRELKVPVPPLEYGEITYITESELNTLISNLPKNDFSNAILLSFYSGFHLGELRQ